MIKTRAGTTAQHKERRNTMSETQTIRRTVTVDNAAHLDEVTVHFEVDVNCQCASGQGGSYITTEPARR